MCLVTQSCPTLYNLMEHSPPGSSVHGDSPGKNTGVGSHTLLQGNLPDPGIKPGSAALQADSFPAELHGKPHHHRWLDLKQANPHLNPHRPTQSSLSSDDITPFLSQLGPVHQDEL